MNKIIKSILFSIALLTFGTIYAENSNNMINSWGANSADADSVKVVHSHNIIDQLAVPDTIAGTKVIVYQSSQITHMIKPRRDANGDNMKGYRIQVYSSNRGQGAREKAFHIEKEILEKHPNLDVYVTYTAPFWKVRIGNCTSYEEARSLRHYIMSEFPEYATETNIVPSNIFVAN